VPAHLCVRAPHRVLLVFDYQPQAFVTATTLVVRFPVSRLLGLLAVGQSRDEILRAYPYLEAADIAEVLRYAASLAEDEIIELTG
jgi:hypothetical protein